jgi:hypothetical protein
MIFSIQRYIEDYFQRRSLSDVDQYAVRVANSFAKRVQHPTDVELLKSIHRIRTVFFQNNSHLNRAEFESKLIQLMRSRFKKKDQFDEFPGGVRSERRFLLRQPRVTIQSIIRGFVRAVEARAVDTFWQSRRNGKLIKRPERIGQTLFAVFAKGVLSDHRFGLVLREMSCGIGFVDIAIVIRNRLHLIEMKVIRGRFTGVGQLETYMETEDRKHGWLIYFDARSPTRRDEIPSPIITAIGQITVVGIDINPIVPSQK